MVLSKLAVAILPNTDTAKSVIMSEWKPWHVSFSWLVVRFHDLRQKHRQRTDALHVQPLPAWIRRGHCVCYFVPLTQSKAHDIPLPTEAQRQAQTAFLNTTRCGECTDYK